jgi:probable DNA repair protein
LLELTTELLEHLETGGTVIVPSRQRAAALRRAHSAAQLSQGRCVWTSPDILPWNAWVQRELDAARGRGEALPRRLSPTEEWLLWREAVQQACAALPVLLPDALIDSVRRAVGLLDDFELAPAGAATPQTGLLLQAREHFRRRCGELSVLGSSSWRECAPWLTATPRMLVVGFTDLGAARRRWLTARGARVAGGGGGGGPAQLLACESAALEAEAAADWCAQLLAGDGGARLLVVVPRLAEQRHLWQRAFAQRLDYGPILAGRAERGESAFAIEGGQPLSLYPLVSSALQLLAIAAGQADFAQLSAVLRCPYQALIDADQAVRIDLWLREQNLQSAELAVLRALQAPMAAALGEAAASAWHGLLAALEGAAPPPEPRSAAPHGWAQSFAALLARCGWPGRLSLDSDEQQLRVRFDELLGELAAIALDGPPLRMAEARDWLQQMADRAAFESATDDVPVTLTSSTDDPIVHYDGLWVAGLSADAWPAAAHPDPLLPLALQRAAGVRAADAAGQLRLAVAAMAQWQRCATRCVWSWPRSDGDRPLDVSPLLREVAAAQAAVRAPAAPLASSPAGGAGDAQLLVASQPSFRLEEWIASQAPAMTAWRDASGSAWPLEQPLRGGIRLLELQSWCPFRGFAELRLQSKPLTEPAPGIDARLRGRVLHRALELFWRSTRDWQSLRAGGPEARLSRVRGCVQRALEELAVHIPARLAPPLLRREQARSEQVIMRLLDWELAREPFEIHALEWAQPHVIAGATLRVQLDRVDRLSDGRLAVIDYKTGTPEKFEAFAARAQRPQLPAYASVAGNATAAVAAVYLGREAQKLRGVADRAGRLPGIEALDARAGDWSQLLAHWNEQLQALVQEYLRGEAAVHPQPGACDYCHLHIFCRIDSALADAAMTAQQPEVEAVEAQSEADAQPEVEAQPEVGEPPTQAWS